MPRLPLAWREQLTWHDYVPVGLVTTGAREAVVGFFSSVYPKLATVKVTQTFVDENRVETVIEAGLLHLRRRASVELDRHKGFATVTVDDITLRRLNHES